MKQKYQLLIPSTFLLSTIPPRVYKTNINNTISNTSKQKTQSKVIVFKNARLCTHTHIHTHTHKANQSLQLLLRWSHQPSETLGCLSTRSWQIPTTLQVGLYHVPGNGVWASEVPRGPHRLAIHGQQFDIWVIPYQISKKNTDPLGFS